MKHQKPQMFVSWSLRHRGAALAIGLCLSWLLVTGERLPAQAKKKKPLAGPEDVTFRTKDQKLLAGTYYASNQGKEAPVVVLLHMKGGNRLVWRILAPKLQQQGFAVITVDLRGHGQSKGGSSTTAKKKATKKKSKGKSKRRNVEDVNLRPQDYHAMVRLDLEAVKKFIYEQHQEQKLNMRKMGIVAAGMSSAVAVNFAARDWNKEPYEDGLGSARTPRGQDVRALVLLSPQPAGPVPEGKVWSPEHGHWHGKPTGVRVNPALKRNATPRAQPPGPPPEGKIWSAEHGHWHNAPKESDGGVSN